MLRALVHHQAWAFPFRLMTLPFGHLGPFGPSALQPVELEQVRRTGDEPLFNSLMEHYHYLGYEQPVGEHLKYLAWAQGRPIACLACFRFRTWLRTFWGRSPAR